MEPKKPDRRLLRTKRRIREAFVQLAMEKSVDQMTVKELAELADIDRKTFYLHYGAITDVVEEMQNEVLERLKLILRKYDLVGPDFNALELFREINGLINEQPEFYNRLVTTGGYAFFNSKVKDALKSVLHEQYQNYGTRIRRELCFEYVTAGVMAVYVQWFSRKDIDLEDVAEAATAIVFGGVRQALTAGPENGKMESEAAGLPPQGGEEHGDSAE